MQKSNAPTKLTVAFASGTGAGPVNTIPLTTNPTSGGASYQTGFTSVNMEPIASGGVPPYGADVNGLFQNQTKAQIWQQAGYMYPFDATFAGNANIGGYPAGSVLMMGSGKGLWLNQSDNNTASPDTTGSAGWLGLAAAGTSTINTTGGTTTPDPSALGVTTLLVTGALTSNATLVLPLIGGVRWIVVNNTTGAFTLTVQGSSGTGVSVTSGSPIAVFTDGTNYYGVSANLSGAYLPINGTAVAATKLATARTIAMTGDVSWTSPAFDGTANVTAAGTIVIGAVSLAKMANFQANSLMGNPTGSVAAPSAITLQNGLTFSGSNLGLGAITPSSVNASGAITAGGLLTATVGMLVSKIDPPSTSSNQGFQFWWNVNAAGIGRNEYINNYGTGTGGHYFYCRSLTTGALIEVANISASGTQTITSTATNPANATSFASNVSGSYGGGYHLKDGSNDIGLWSTTGTLNIGFGTNGGALTSKFTIDPNGNVSSTGTINFGTSDAELKDLGTPIEPRPFHRVPYYAYTRKDTGERGWGPTAQDVATIAPEYTRSQCLSVNGDDQDVLLLAKEQITMDTAFWAGRQVDLLWEEVADLRRQLADARAH